MNWGQFLAFGFGAVVTASLAYYFNKKIQESVRKWETEKHVIRTAEGFCDELIKDSVTYWTSTINEENCDEMQAQAGKIAAMSTLVSVFLKENYPSDSNIHQSLRKMINSVTGDSFGSRQRRGANLEKAGSSANTLIKLRIAVSQKARV
ncbi:MAG: hypothetical protein OXF42_05345 [Candidatus Dadabacteria bacterium]|nr:hypothetical protein [Candidatus Dadabacteria bacterium]